MKVAGVAALLASTGLVAAAPGGGWGNKGKSSSAWTTSTCSTDYKTYTKTEEKPYTTTEYKTYYKPETKYCTSFLH